MTIQARVHADRIELIVVVSAHFAGVILDESGDGPALSADTFQNARSRLELRASQLCVLRSGGSDGTPLPLAGVDVVQGERDEVVFFLGYRRAGASRFTLEIPLLERIESGYRIGVRVADHRRRLLAAKELSRGDSTLTVTMSESGAEAEKGQHKE